jgi:dTDP-4-dehydrorhamnose reductase
LTDALVLGAAGQLGSELVRLLGADAGVTHQAVSITDAAAVESLIAQRRPAVVFNCAAYNAVDRAETEPEAAFDINAHGPANVAAVCTRYGARLVHFSTNFVFDGRLDRPYVESDEPSPLSVYARSKLEGERVVLRALPDALVIRTAAVFGGHGGQSFPERILQRARRGETLRVVSDQRVNPTYAGDLAQAALRLVDQRLAGVLHAVAGGCCGWDELARAVLEECGLTVGVQAITTADYPAAARRPVNGCLASTRTDPLRPWREGLRDWVKRM